MYKILQLAKVLRSTSQAYENVAIGGWIILGDGNSVVSVSRALDLANQMRSFGRTVGERKNTVSKLLLGEDCSRFGISEHWQQASSPAARRSHNLKLAKCSKAR